MINDTHYVKSWPHLFAAAREGSKRFDLRKADRDFKVGDFLVLQEYEPMDTQEYTGEFLWCRITYITDAGNPCAFFDAGLKEGFCILGFDPL